MQQLKIEIGFSNDQKKSIVAGYILMTSLFQPNTICLIWYNILSVISSSSQRSLPRRVARVVGRAKGATDRPLSIYLVFFMI